MVNYSATVHATFAALADPVSMRVVARLSRGEATVSHLAADHQMSLPAFLKHIRSLEEAGVITTRKRGRVRTCRLRAAALSQAEGWLSRHRRFWEGQLDSLEHYLSSQDLKEEKKPR
jgi:DNA-binding transcriptional ArsR family regulator